MSVWPSLTPLLLAQPGGDLGVLTMIARSGWMVKGVLILLFLLSVMTWAILFYKWRLLRHAERQTRQFHRLYAGEQKLSVIFERSEQLDSSPVAYIFRTGYSEYRKTVKQRNEGTSAPEGSFDASEAPEAEIISRSISRSIDSELTRLSKHLPFLATTGSTAPFIGLFGTVWGIMNAFRAIGLAGSASLASVAPGISEALVTTAAGLAAAIPAVMGYNYFVQRIGLLENEMRSFASDFINLTERHLRRKA